LTENDIRKEVDKAFTDGLGDFVRKTQLLLHLVGEKTVRLIPRQAFELQALLLASQPR
jgi:hypothetical protein